jgi:hypothetical protein
MAPYLKVFTCGCLVTDCWRHEGRFYAISGLHPALAPIQKNALSYKKKPSTPTRFICIRQIFVLADSFRKSCLGKSL